MGLASRGEIKEKPGDWEENERGRRRRSSGPVTNHGQTQSKKGRKGLQE